MDTKLIVSASPHLRSEETTTGLMANVIVALTPCVVASAIIFGLRALLVTAVSVVACVAFEWLYCKLMKKANPIGDLSAVVTGIILALNVPVGMPIGELLIGDFVAIIVVKQLFGGRHELCEPRSGGPYRAVHQLRRRDEQVGVPGCSCRSAVLRDPAGRG